MEQEQGQERVRLKEVLLFLVLRAVILFGLLFALSTRAQNLYLTCPPSISCSPNISAGGGVLGSGTINYIPFFNTNNSIATSIVYQTGYKLVQGKLTSSAYFPTFTEYFFDNGSGSPRKQRLASGALSTGEMNLSVNMDYTTKVHHYYDSTQVAIWSWLGNTNGSGLQYVPANNSNQADIFSNYGAEIFHVLPFSQPSTGNAIPNFTSVQAAEYQFADINNTYSITTTQSKIYQDNGFLKYKLGSSAALNVLNSNYVYSNNTQGPAATFQNTNTGVNAFTGFIFKNNASSFNTFLYSTSSSYDVGIPEILPNQFVFDHIGNGGLLFCADQTSGDIVFATGSAFTPRETIKNNGYIIIPDLTTTSFTVTDGNQGLGKIFTSDANGVGSWQNSPIQFGSVTLNSAQIQSLSPTSTYTIISAPGPGKYIDVISGFAVVNFNTTAYTGGGNINYVYANLPGENLLQYSTTLLVSTSTKYSKGNTPQASGSGTPENLAVTISASGTPVLGDSPVKFYYSYTINDY